MHYILDSTDLFLNIGHPVYTGQWTLKCTMLLPINLFLRNVASTTFPLSWSNQSQTISPTLPPCSNKWKQIEQVKVLLVILKSINNFAIHSNLFTYFLMFLIFISIIQTHSTSKFILFNNKQCHTYNYFRLNCIL